MTTQAKRPVGRPKKADQPKAEVQQKRPKSLPIKRKESAIKGWEYEIWRNPALATVLTSKGKTIFDESKNTVRSIRYCPNEPSIYLDEQSEHAYIEPIIFRNGKLFVPKNKPNLKEYLDAYPANEANGGNLFRLVDTERDAEKELETEFIVADAVSKVRDTPIEELLPVAIYFNINIDSPSSEIRFNLLNLAKKDPSEFLDAFNDPQVVARSLAKQASDYQFIALRENGVYWFDTNKLIVTVPVGRNPLDVITRFLLTEQGSSVYAEIEEKLAKLA